MGERGEIFSEKLFTDSDRTYFFNVKENRKGDYFLNIVESKKDANGEFERHSVFVYEENIEEFEENILKAISIIKRKIKDGDTGTTEKKSFGDEQTDTSSKDFSDFSRERSTPRDRGDRPRFGGGDRPRFGGGDRPRSGGGDRPRSGGGDRPRFGGGDRPRFGGGDRPRSGGGDRPRFGGGDRPRFGGARSNNNRERNPRD